MDQATFLILVQFSAILAGFFVMFNLCCFFVYPSTRRFLNRVIYPFVPHREARELLSVLITVVVFGVFVFAVISRLGMQI